MDYRFAAPIENDFFNLVSRVDYKAADNHSFFARIGKQDDTINTAPQFEDARPLRQRLFNNWGGAIGYDAVLSPTLTNSFRYGFTKIDENNAGLTNSNYNTFRFISPYDGVGLVVHRYARKRRRRTSSTTCRGSRARHTMKVGTNIRFTRVPKNRFQSSYLSATVNPSWVAGVGRRNMPGSSFCTVPGCNLPAVATGFQAGYADAWLNIIGVLSQATQRANYNKDGTPQAPGTRGGARDRLGRVRVVHPGRVAAAPEPDHHRRRALQPLLAAVRERTACRSRRRSAWASGSTSASRT